MVAASCSWSGSSTTPVSCAYAISVVAGTPCPRVWMNVFTTAVTCAGQEGRGWEMRGQDKRGQEGRGQEGEGGRGVGRTGVDRTELTLKQVCSTHLHGRQIEGVRQGLDRRSDRGKIGPI